MHRFADYLELAALLARLFIVPRVELQTALDKNRASFFQILARHFRRASPKGDVDKGDFFALFPVVERVLAIDRNSEICRRRCPSACSEPLDRA